MMTFLTLCWAEEIEYNLAFLRYTVNMESVVGLTFILALVCLGLLFVEARSQSPHRTRIIAYITAILVFLSVAITELGSMEKTLGAQNLAKLESRRDAAATIAAWQIAYRLDRQRYAIGWAELLAWAQTHPLRGRDARNLRLQAIDGELTLESSAKGGSYRLVWNVKQGNETAIFQELRIAGSAKPIRDCTGSEFLGCVDSQW